jgi:hypothetical protein
MTGGHRRFFTSLAAALFLCGSAASAGTPCDGVDRTLRVDQKAALRRAIAQQLKVPKPEILQTFRLGDWSIVYAATGGADRTFVFFKGSPERNRYITRWAGAAQSGEEEAIEKWTLENAPGIPSTLAQCFAYHVTQDRDM